MTISFAEAVAAVRTLRASDWAGTAGTLYVDPDGAADAEDYLVAWGAREFLVDGNLDFLLMNGLVTFVSIESGEIRDELMIENFDKVDRMVDVTVSAPAHTDPLSWSATTPVGYVRWDDPGKLSGSPSLVALVEAALADPAGFVLATPTGPSLDLDVTDPAAVFAAVLVLDLPGIRFAGAVPDFTFGVPVGAES